MKKLIFLSLIFLTSCLGSTTVTPTYDIRRDFTPTPSFTEIFRTSAQCPQICWLGIHPGTTSVEQAIRIVENSSQFEQQGAKISSESIEAYWYRNKGQGSTTTVHMILSNGLVKSMSLSRSYFTVDDLVHLLGKPAGISFRIGQYPYGAGPYTIYTLYYPSFNTRIIVHIEGADGPAPVDIIETLEIGIESINNSLSQPWLGYRKLEAYFPTGTPTAYPPDP